MKLAFFVLFFLCLSCTTYGQTPYGNEWLVPNQRYVKIKVSENGVYRINYNQLLDLGFLSTNPNPKNFQIFFLGKQIPLFIQGESDNTFNSGDFIEFYGLKNSGITDESLYSNQDQPNKEVSLFTDEASYFLTIGINNGQRYETINNASTGLTSDEFVIATSSLNFVNQYYPGQYVLDVMTFSDYIEGEGYLGQTFSLGTSQSHLINTPFKSNTINFTPFLEFYVAGRSNALSTNPLGNNHHLRVLIGNKILSDTLFRGYKTIRSRVNLSTSDILDNTNITFSSINDIGAQTDFQAPSYARITYARNLDLSNISSLNFKISTTNSTLRLLNFTNSSNWINPILLDYISGKRYIGAKNAAITSFTIHQTQDEIIAYHEAAIKTPILQSVVINPININTFSSKMMMITHQSLLVGANELAAYKNAKGISTSVVTTDDLYNQFYYGIHHPLAIKNFNRFLLKESKAKPEFLLLLGKGWELSRNNINQDLVPTFGFPPSDISLSSGIIDNTLAPGIATGRVPAKNNQEVRDYLDKIKLYDRQPDEIWRKSIINITGGKNSSEDITFSSYLRNFSNTASREYFGATTTSYFKSVTDPVTDNLTEKINRSIEAGASLLTFLGHGSTVSTAVSIGNPNNINNSDKLLFYYINGCSTGNAFTTGSLGENYIFQKDKGAIGWIGTSSEGVASYLYGIGNLFYQNSFKDNYSQSVASNIARSIKSYQNQNDFLNKIHCQQFIFLGDPSLRFYSPEKPDYEINNQSIGLVERDVTANSPSFNLMIIVKNRGKALTENLKIKVRRTLSNNNVIDYPVLSANPVFHTDTIFYPINNDIPNIAGANRFSVYIDIDNQIEELNEQNNTAEFNFFMPSNGITTLYPKVFSIEANENVNLKVQANNLLTNNAEYIFEIDTNKTFTSNWKKNSGIISSGLFASWTPSINYEANKVYYWRARLNLDFNNGGQWQSSSFTYVPNALEGWNQGHYQQFENTQLNNIVVKNKEFEYTKTAYPIYVQTRGNNAPTNSERRIRVSISVGAVAFNSSEFEGFSILALNPINSTRSFNYPSRFNFKNDGVNGTGQFFYNTNNQEDIDSLVRFVNQIPNGYYVIGMSGRNFSGKNLPSNAKQVLQSLGLNMFEMVESGQPYIFSGEKGIQIGTAREVTADYSSTTPADAQAITLNYDLLNAWNNGFYVSEKIGPALEWNKVELDFNRDQQDIIQHQIIGVSQTGTETIIKSGITDNLININDVNAELYPFIKIKSIVQDNTNFTVAKLKYWRSFYKQYPEVSLNPEFANDFYKKDLDEGDSLRVKIGISNIGLIQSDSILIRYNITKSDRSTINGMLKTNPPLLVNENKIINFSLPSIGLSGNNTLQLLAEPKNKKETYIFNNILSYNFNVNRDIKSPLLDLTFDGKRIINGEIISPTPSINITLIDENKYIALSDTSLIELYLKRQEEDEFKRVFFSTNKLSLNDISNNQNKISFLYQPSTLENGIYTLRVKSKDASGNINTSDLQTDFEVINEQSISHFLPYPNPVINSTRFVFTVTGAKVPDKIKVQIMTVSGKVVKEISKEELGNIRIGQNISDFQWDGTDTFGDRLANGVYFYQVISENSDGTEIKKRTNTKTDAMFKRNFGKIYLMK
ncbi:hypothetical protein PBAC_01370 [Pedobacter glucosidilyticus]|nr:C25 family cysteine peptidase [Pedobacter glucosidilyticus]KHJ39626.1 hypothetical protein PBAC_01370 [Pedobacter glucosidilyticus]